MRIESFLPDLKKNVLLKNYTTFQIGGLAKYFFVVKTKANLISAIKIAKKFNLPFFVLGGGSNLLFSDKGFKGMIIKCQMLNVKCQNQNSNFKIIFSESGVRLSDLLKLSLKKSLSGLEWTIGIPGTIGGAIYGNAGAFGSSMADIVKEVEVLDAKNLKIKKLKKRDCQFDYRESIFKKNKNLIIISANLKLKKEKKKEIQKKIKEFLAYRKKTQPLNLPSVGSIFKNPKGFSVGELIEKVGLKGEKIGNVKISEKHANFIVNLGGGKAKDVKKLIKLIKKRVKKKFKINLEEEITILNKVRKFQC